MQRRGRSGRGFTLIELLVVLVIIALLVGLLLPAISKALCAAKQTRARSMIEALRAACETYEKDQMKYPDDSSGGSPGSQKLYEQLKSQGPRNHPYMEIKEGMVSQDNHFINPVYYAGGSTDSKSRLHYRRNAGQNPAPAGAKNTYTFDLWGRDCKGQDDGVNNWTM